MMKKIAERTVVVISLAITVLIFFNFFQRYRYRDDARQEMRHLMSRLKVGDSQTQVRNVFKSGSYQALNLQIKPGTTRWYVRTPLEWGADNWLLLLDFSMKGRLAVARLRTDDSIKWRPKESAPADF